jgi:hypothetical protein
MIIAFGGMKSRCAVNGLKSASVLEESLASLGEPIAADDLGSMA